MKESKTNFNIYHCVHKNSASWIKVYQDHIYTLKQGAQGKAVFCYSIKDKTEKQLSLSPSPQTSIGYGGVPYTVKDNTLLFSGSDKAIHKVDLTTGQQTKLTTSFQGCGQPVIGKNNFAFLAESSSSCDIYVGSLTSHHQIKVTANPWYAFNPHFSADGKLLTWQEWDQGQMPWTESRLVVQEIETQNGQAILGEKLIFEEKQTNFSCPLFHPNKNKLLYSKYSSEGFRSLFIYDFKNKTHTPLYQAEGDIGYPEWQAGIYSYRWSSCGNWILCLQRTGVKQLLLILQEDGSLAEKPSLPCTAIEDLDTYGEHLAIIGSSPQSAGGVYFKNIKDKAFQMATTFEQGILKTENLVDPKVIEWHSGESKVEGILYDCGKKQAPLLVRIHGGPTAQSILDWQPEAQFFADLGWHTLFVNHRGSIGYGRPFEQALNGQWGHFDIEDAKSGALYLAAQGVADKEQLVIMGGSAGGYSTLMALTTQNKIWAAGISLYGISEQFSLAKECHRFEQGYTESLIGKLPDCGQTYKERSPINHVKNLQAPVLLVHGEKDLAVPPEQSISFQRQAQKLGKTCELILFPDEGHGIKKPANKKHYLNSLSTFLYKYVQCKQF